MSEPQMTTVREWDAKVVEDVAGVIQGQRLTSFGDYRMNEAARAVLDHIASDPAARAAVCGDLLDDLREWLPLLEPAPASVIRSLIAKHTGSAS